MPQGILRHVGWETGGTAKHGGIVCVNVVHPAHQSVSVPIRGFDPLKMNRYR